MILFLETLHEHALGIDFFNFGADLAGSSCDLPLFPPNRGREFPQWHASYCNRISFFVLPLMGMQLIESVSSCFSWDESGNGSVCPPWSWLGESPFFTPACHRKLSKGGRNDKVIGVLLRGNRWRSLAWTLAFLASWMAY